VTADPKLLDTLSRDELIAEALRLGVKRPELLTRFELRDEIIRLSEPDVGQRKRARGWFGVARDLVASVVEQGLNLPDAAEVIRGGYVPSGKPAPPVATVTLAEIYASQGHLEKALLLLDEVLRSEPEHAVAAATRARLQKERDEQRMVARGSVPVAPAPEPAEPEDEPATEDEESALDSGVVSVAPAEPAVSIGTQPAAPLPEPPPPRDLLVVVRLASGRACASWEITEETLVSLRDEGRGEPRLFVVQVRPSWDGPVQSARCLPIAEPVGQAWLDVEPQGILRASLGWERDERFFPLLVGAELSLSLESDAELVYRPAQSPSPDDWRVISTRAVRRVVELAAARP
jgi:hypothetical protein